VRNAVLIALASVLSAGCGRQAPPAYELIQNAVQATIAALPTSAPPPVPTPYSSATPTSLSGVFCEYEFCIGHPKGLAFFDVVAKENPHSPAASSYEEGRLATSGVTTFIEVIWRANSGAPSPEYLLDLIVDDRVDTRKGEPEAITVGALGGTFVPLATSATELLPSAAAAAWSCGERAFAWKVYASTPELPGQLLGEALEAFRCNP